MTILRNPTSEQIITAIEKNLFAWQPELGRLGRVVNDDPPGVRRVISDRQMSMCNCVMDIQLEPEQACAAIERTIEDARQRRVPIDWWITPSTRPADLAQLLIRYGFSIEEENSCMAVNLKHLNDNFPMPQGLTIQRALGNSAYRIWSETMEAGFERTATAQDVIDTMTDFLDLVDPQTMQAFTGFFGGKPVATSLLFLAAGVAQVECISTIPEARRKGIGARITLHPLQIARQQGYEIGIVQASEQGSSLYRRLGFREYCRITSYVWQL